MRPDPMRTMPTLMSACVVVVVAMVAAINLALTELAASSLHPDATALLWIVDSYLLVFGCLLIPAGALADRWGRKGAILVGLGLFAAGCGISAAAGSVAVLLAGRVVTGAGAALVMPSTLALLLQVTPAVRRSHAIATWTAATGAAGALGNLGGGLVLDRLPWQGLFLVMGPLALLLAVAVAFLAPRGERRDTPLDITGAVLLTLATFALLIGIVEGPGRGWTSAPVVGAFLAAVVLVTAFVAHASRSAAPLVDPRLFRIPSVRIGAIGVATVFFGLFGLFFVNAQYLQHVRGYSPLLTGVAILPLPMVMVVVSRRSVGWAARIGARSVVLAGFVALSAGLGVLSLVDATTPYAVYATGLMVVAAGMGLAVPSLSGGIMSALPPSLAGMGSGLNSAAREVGSALGVAVVGTVLSSRQGSEASRPAADEFVGAMAVGYRVVVVVVLLVAVGLARSYRSADRTLADDAEGATGAGDTGDAALPSAVPRS